MVGQRWIILLAAAVLLCLGNVGVTFSQTSSSAVEGHIDSLNVAQGTLTLNTGFSLPVPPVTVVDATGREGSAGVAELQGLLRNGVAVALDFRQDTVTGAKVVTRIQVAGTGGLGAIPDQSNRLKGTIGAASVTATGGFVRLLFFACRIVSETKVFDEKGAAITPGGLHKDDRVRVTPAPTTPGIPQTPNAAEVRVLERATQPPPTTGTGMVHLVSFKVDGTALKAGEKTAPVPAGKHRFEVTFDAPLNIHVDPESGDLDLGGVEILALPPFPEDPEDIAPTADGKGFTGTVDLPANATYQIVISTDPEGSYETTSGFYFGTTALSDARVSGSVTLPGEAHGGEVGDGIVLLLSAPPEAIFESESASKAARAAKRAVKRLMSRSKPGVLQDGEGSEEDPLLDATVRIAGIVDDLSFTHLYVPNGQYYLLALADVGLDGELHDLFGVYDIDGDGASDPVTVRDGRSVEGLEVTGILIDDGGEPPSPAVRGIVARVDLAQSQFAIGSAIQFDPNQVNVFGGQGGRISVQDLQPGFPVLVTLEPGSTPLRATEVRIVRLGQTVEPGPNQTTGTIDRIDARSLFLIERRFQFDQNTFFVDSDDNPIQARNLTPGDFVEVEVILRGTPPDYAAYVKVLPSGYAPGQNPDQVTGAAFITRTGTVQADGATNLPTNPQLQVSFNGPANQDFINRVEVLIFPYSDNTFLSYEAKNGRLVADLSLRANTAYTMWVLIHDGQKAPFLVHFTTGTAFPGGAVSGQVGLPAAKDIPGLPGGASLAFNPNTGGSVVVLLTQDPATALPLLDSEDESGFSQFLSLIAGVGVIQPGGVYTVRNVPAGSYYVAASARVVALQGPTGPIVDGTERELRGFYDVTPPGDGKADRVSVQGAEVKSVNLRVNPPPALKVVKTSPAVNAVNVPLKTKLSFTFSDRVRVSDDGTVEAQVGLFPEARSGPIYQEDLSLSTDGRTVSVDVELDGNTTYQAFVFYAESNNESLLPVTDLTAQTGFSTGPAVGTGQVSGVVDGIPGGTISRDTGLIFTYLISEGIDLRDLGPGDFDPVSASFGATDGNLFGAKYIPGGRYYVLVEVYRFEDESSFYGFLADAQGKPRVLQVGQGQNIQNLRVQVSPNNPFEQETQALRVLSVQSFDGINTIDLQEGVGGVPVRTQIVVTFSEPIQVSREFVGVDAELIPAAKSGNLFGQGKFLVRDQGRQVVFTVELETNKDYQFIVRGAVGVSGAELRESEERFFSTSAQQVVLGSVNGKISLSDKSRPHGSVFASVKSGTNEIVIAQVDADSAYTFPRLPDGKYFITADLTLGNGLKVGGFYDKNGDGKRDDNDAVEIRSGSRLSSIDIGPLTVSTVVPGPGTGGPNLKAVLSFDFGTGKGDDKQTELKNVGAAADVNVSVYVQGVKDLTGYTVTIGFDPKKLAFNGAENDNTSEGTNILKSSGGVAVFLPPSIKGGNSVEFGGAVLAATEATSPDGDGLIGVFHFKTTETFADTVTVVSVPRLVLKSLAGADTLALEARATVSAPGQGGPTAPGLTPKAGDGTAVLDLDTASDDQKTRTVNNVKAGQKVDVQVLLNKEYANATGFQVVLKFDPTKVTVAGYRKDGAAFASAIDLPAQTKADSVTYGASILGGTTTAKGALAVLTFEAVGGYTGDTEITLQTLQVRVSGAANTLKPGASVVLSSSAGSGPSKPTPDFSGDGEVGFDDFFLFASAFGQKATGDNAKFDLDGDGEVGFGDFFAFASAFGTKVSGKPALAKPVGLGAVGTNGKVQVTLNALPTDRPDLVTVEVGVAGAASVRGYGLSLSYDPAELELIESKPAGLFGAGVESRPTLRLSDGLGQVHLADALRAGSIVGEGELSHLVFRVRPGGGLGSLWVEGGLLLDGEGLANRVDGARLAGGLRPLSYRLGQSYPNPFNPVTQIAYQVVEAGQVHLVIYSVLGQRVRTLVDGQVQAGFYRVSWDGRDDLGRTVSSGVYLYRMEAGAFSQVHKMLLLK